MSKSTKDERPHYEAACSIVNRASSFAPNSNFRIDGFDGQKHIQIVEAILEHLEVTNAALFELAMKGK